LLLSLSLSQSQSQSQRFCSFFLDGNLFGIPVPQVQEVIKFQEMTRVPLAAPVISGLINLRGQIITAIDMRLRLKMAKRPADKPPVNVVVRSGEGAVGLLVDDIGDVIEVGEETLEPPPDTLDGMGREIIRGVYKLPEHLLLALDVERAIDIADLAWPLKEDGK
jgi:purine-binding chemotaxis protein CheW